MGLRRSHSFRHGQEEARSWLAHWGWWWATVELSGLVARLGNSGQVEDGRDLRLLGHGVQGPLATPSPVVNHSEPPTVRRPQMHQEAARRENSIQRHGTIARAPDPSVARRGACWCFPAARMRVAGWWCLASDIRGEARCSQIMLTIVDLSIVVFSCPGSCLRHNRLVKVVSTKQGRQPGSETHGIWQIASSMLCSECSRVGVGGIANVFTKPRKDYLDKSPRLPGRSTSPSIFQ